jgi:hypothetical protein
MVVTVAQIVIQLQGVEYDPPAPITEYYIFGHRVTVAAIEQWIADMTAFHNEYWDASILSTKAALIDLLIRYDVCFNVMGVPVMGTLMISGVSYHLLENKVDKGDAFTKQVQEVANRLYGQYSRVRGLLQDNISTDVDMTMGEESWQEIDELFPADSIPLGS